MGDQPRAIVLIVDDACGTVWPSRDFVQLFDVNPSACHSADSRMVETDFDVPNLTLSLSPRRQQRSGRAPQPFGPLL